MVRNEITILNERGLHARAAAKFVQLSSTFRSEITLGRDGYEVNGKSILGLLTLAATIGTKLTLTVDGPDETSAADALVALAANHFDEDSTLTDQEKKS